MPIQLSSGEPDKETVRQYGAFIITALALILSVSGIGDSNSTERGARNNVLAADSYAWYQAKNIRQTSYELARDDLRVVLELSNGSMSSEAIASIKERIAFYEAEIARYESEPDPEEPDNLLKGEGKVQLLAQAQDYEQQRTDAGERGNSFDYAVVVSGVGIVLAAAGVLIASLRFLAAGVLMGVVAVCFLLNAAFSFVSLDFYIT
jgi:hypothetical protein